MNNAPSLAKVEVTALKGVGAQLADKLAKIHIHSIQDLLFHLPLRYMDRTRVSPIGAVQPLASVVIEGEVKACDVVFGRRRSLVCRLQDGTGLITLRFFHFSAAQKKRLVPGARLRCFGEARRGASGLELYHPEYDFIDAKTPLPLESTLTPVYPATEGITQQRLRSLTEQALALMSSHSLEELIPDDAWKREPYPLSEALAFLHHPPKEAPIDELLSGTHAYQQRLAFEELLAHHLSMLRVRQRIQADGARPLPTPTKLLEAFRQQLGFTLTGAQQRVADEIAADLSQPYPMLRLVQGDVGSGKTVVAALAALQAVGNGLQAAIMAPTEILAEQHRQSFSQWLEPLGIKVGWLSGRQKVAERRQQLAAMASGETQVIVGTHALFQDGVEFADLGLTIIDEQHRFGVHQRLALREKARGPGDEDHGGRSHQLIMTATPIPRTLAMSVYADLDCSIIDELPPGRTPVATVAISNERRSQVVERVRAACLEGRQAYWVCTLIEESEMLEAQAAEAIAQSLGESLPDIRVGLVHGRLKPAEKEEQMQRFKAGDLQLLVATTVIEVGVDVPNASLMIIENPERLGLAQLHQLRGRVGRGTAASHCVLLYGSPLSQYSRERLKAMRETNDGFVIAEKDLELRGPGEVLGTRQTGEVNFRLADLQRDGFLLPRIKEVATHILSVHPEVVDALIGRWLGSSENYASV
ncbi:ATP-dependent DNA helicase RecG [Aestuariicella hydrocarbonica]|uniref:ATP-dependent DNA helicase RecG n=1 Tax=Pseudomaricurvus hydrocarbonicus TaxID=1470433 RepID=A0A9E5MPX7_9GAMM|nr:ATP-dependent DNA helicase RecG [Aestuariicella hydrocarbonica]